MLSFGKGKKLDSYGVISSRGDQKSSGVLSKYANKETVFMIVVIMVIIGIYFGVKFWGNMSDKKITEITGQQTQVLSDVTNDQSYYDVVQFVDKVRGLNYVLSDNKQSFVVNYTPNSIIDNFNKTLHKGVSVTALDIDFKKNDDEEDDKPFVLMNVAAISQPISGKDILQVVGEQELIWYGRDESEDYSEFSWLMLEEFSTSYEVEERGIVINAKFKVYVDDLDVFIKDSGQVQGLVGENSDYQYIYEEVKEGEYGYNFLYGVDNPPPPPS